MERVHGGTWWLGALFACASCAGGQTGESPGEPLALYKGGDGRCESRACAGKKPSREALSEFGDNFGGVAGDYEPFDTLDEAVNRPPYSPSFIATGWLVGVEQGRRSDFHELCIPERPDDEGSRTCVGREAAYSSYVNLVIEAESVLRGQVPVPAQYLRVELHWPNNRPIEDLLTSASLALGARMLLLSKWVATAHAEAAPLVDAGIDPGYIADNLLAAIPYGMTSEDAEGFAVPGFYLDAAELALLVDPSGGPVRFDDLVSAVRAALE